MNQNKKQILSKNMQLGDLLAWCTAHGYDVLEETKQTRIKLLTGTQPLMQQSPDKTVDTVTNYSVFYHGTFLAGNLTYEELVEQLRNLFDAQNL